MSEVKVRMLKLVNGEEIIGQTDGEVKDGFIKLDKIVRIMILPPERGGEQPKIAFADYVPYAFPVGSYEKPADRKSKEFAVSQLLHPPMEVQDQLEAEYKRLWSPVMTPTKELATPDSGLILPANFMGGGQ